MAYRKAASLAFKLLSNPEVRKRLPDAARQGRAIAEHLAGREKAIRRAAEMEGGQVSECTLGGRRHWVVWREGEPVEAHPPFEGNLADELRHYRRDRLRRPEDLARYKVRRRAADIAHRGRRTK